MNLKAMLNERSQPQTFHFCDILGEGKTTGMNNTSTAARIHMWGEKEGTF